MPSSRARGVTEYWGKEPWKNRALATLGRAMMDSCWSSLLGIRLSTHLIWSFMGDCRLQIILKYCLFLFCKTIIPRDFQLSRGFLKKISES